MGSAFQLVADNFTSGSQSGITQRWAYFMPNPRVLSKLARMADSGKLRPVIHKVFKMANLDDAYNMQAAGHMRGKVVVDMS